MIIDYTLKQEKGYILACDLTHNPKIKKLNIQIITPKGRIINTVYIFKKLNIYGEAVLGTMEYGDYTFKVHNIEKLVLCNRNFPLRKMYCPNKNSKYFEELKAEIELSEVEKAYFRFMSEPEDQLITKLKHSYFLWK